MRRPIAVLCALVALIWPSIAQVPMTGAGTGTPKGSSFSLTAQGSSGSSTTGNTIINYGTVSYGSGCNAVLIGIWWYPTAGSNVVSGVSVGGSAASQVSASFTSQGSFSMDLWQLNSPAGSSANITVTYSANVTFNSNVTAYCLVTTTTAVSAVAHNGAGPVSCGVASPVSATISVPAGGGAVVITGDNNGQVLSFTNASSDGVYVGGGVQDRWGHTTSTGSITVSSTPAGTDTCAIAAASWGP
jgi:hypothetical protein